MASQQFLLAKILKTLQFFFNFFWFFAIFFAGFEKKKGHQNLLANRYFLLAKIQKFPKMCSQKKNSHRRANNANNGNSLPIMASCFLFSPFLNFLRLKLPPQTNFFTHVCNFLLLFQFWSEKKAFKPHLKSYFFHC